MAAAAITTRPATGQAQRGRRFCFAGTPEVYFQKEIDNSRLVKVDDPRRARENRVLVVTLLIAFSLVMVYAYQHLKAIDYGYQIEQLRSEHASLEKVNSELRLQESQLSSPQRIHEQALSLGMVDAEPGQIVMLDASAPRMPQGGAMVAAVQHYSVISHQ